MVKTRVHDLAAEFGVAPEQLLGILKEMNIFVRSHLSALEHDQVSAVRVRWEREKRKSAEEPSAKKGRRRAVKAEPAPAPVGAEAEPSADARRPKSRRSRRKLRPRRQPSWRRSSSSVRPALRSRRRPPTQTLEERARALFKDLPPAPAETEEDDLRPSPWRRSLRVLRPRARRRSRPRALHSTAYSSVPRRPPPAVRNPSSAAARHQHHLGPAMPSRPGAPSRPGTPDRSTPVRTFGPDAEKGGGRKKGKKGKRSMVDQDAVQANILKTLQGMKGPAGRKGVRRSDEPSYRELQAGRLAEKKKRKRPASGSTSSSRSPSSPCSRCPRPRSSGSPSRSWV